MDLNLALIGIGVLIVAGVALSAYDVLRINWRRAFGPVRSGMSLLKKRPRRPPNVRRGGLRLEAGAAARAARQTALTAEPDGEEEESASPVLSEAPPAPAAGPTAGATGPARTPRLADEIKTLEHAALMPLNLTLGLENPDAPGDGKRFAAPDPNVDFVITVPGPGPVDRDVALGIFRQNEYVLERPRAIYGLGHRSGQWSNLELDPEFAQYGDLAVAIQLTDARGSATESELNAFVQMALKLADRLKRPTKLSMPFDQALARAKELDAFCEANDLVASVTITTNGRAPFSGRAITQAAAKSGLRFGAGNIFHMKNRLPSGAPHLFSLSNLESPGTFDPDKMNDFRTPALSIFMNVPAAYDPPAVFEQMIAAAQGVAKTLGGKLQDQDGRPLSDQGVQAIRAQIELIAHEMNTHGIQPGSESALRLF